MQYDKVYQRGLLVCLLSLFQGMGGGELFAAELDLFPDSDTIAPIEANGFAEIRAGSRVKNDPNEKDASVQEARIQAELSTYTEQLEFKFKGDLWIDGITEKVETDIRESWVFARPFDFLDLKLGRQVLTWGTGDLVFLNDLFPKDWQSYFIGRDSEYLKAPSDALKATFSSNIVGLDLIYTPQYDPDRYITGEYISYWNSANGGYAGQNDLITAVEPDTWFRDDEVALRIYRNIRNYEIALYGYWGYWKQLGSQSTSGEYIFPKLNVYGSSARGQIAGGIGNVEIAYYDSVEDPDGNNALINNSQIRYLIGYNRDLSVNLNASIQYYIEQTLHYSAYKNSSTNSELSDEFRHLLTLQVTKLLMNQNLELSFSCYYSSSDEDAFLKPKVTYHFSDNLRGEIGANFFMGNESYTFFSQFENNSNVYIAFKYSL